MENYKNNIIHQNELLYQKIIHLFCLLNINEAPSLNSLYFDYNFHIYDFNLLPAILFLHLLHNVYYILSFKNLFNR